MPTASIDSQFTILNVQCLKYVPGNLRPDEVMKEPL
jgi:hypothetical protein